MEGAQALPAHHPPAQVDGRRSRPGEHREEQGTSRGPADGGLRGAPRLADASPGFVWRLQTGEGNAAYLRPYDDDRIIFNMSVWQGLEPLKAYVYTSLHVEVMRHRREWFERFEAPYIALWWVPAGHIPSVDEAKKRLDHLTAHGPTPFAFTFRAAFPPDPAVLAATDWSAFEPCAAR